MQATQKLFIIAVLIVIIIVGTIMGLIAVSLIPHFGEIGNVSTWALFIVLGCGVSLAVAFTWYRIKFMRIRSQILTHGDVMVFRNQDGSFEHLSAEHVRAGVPLPPVTVKELPEHAASSSEDTVLELYSKGVSLRNIAQATNLTYYQVQKITSGKSD